MSNIFDKATSKQVHSIDAFMGRNGVEWALCHLYGKVTAKEFMRAHNNSWTYINEEMDKTTATNWLGSMIGEIKVSK